MKMGIKEIITFGTPYLIGVSAAYLFGYWGSFHVNVLEFIGLTDIAKLAVYPLLASSIFFLAGALFSEVIVSPHLPPGGGADTPLGRLGNRYGRWLMALVVLVAVLFAIYGPEPRKWFFVALLVSCLSIPLTHNEQIIELIPDPRQRGTALFLLFALPALSFGYGKEQAYDIKVGKPVQIVDVARSKLPLLFDETKPVAYLGLLGGIYILREGATGQVVLVKQRDDTPMFLIAKPR